MAKGQKENVDNVHKKDLLHIFRIFHKVSQIPKLYCHSFRVQLPEQKKNVNPHTESTKV